jgi:hypothetical protein
MAAAVDVVFQELAPQELPTRARALWAWMAQQAAGAMRAHFERARAVTAGAVPTA